VSRIAGIPAGTLATVLLAALAVVVAAVSVSAARHPVFLRMGLRNATRRRGRSVVILTGLMLATAIIATALGTGDTVAATVRGSVLQTLGRTDETVVPRGTQQSAALDLGGPGRLAYFPEGTADRIAASVRRHPGTFDGSAPAILAPVAVQDVSSRQNEPRIMLFAPGDGYRPAFGPMVRTDGSGRGRRVALDDLPVGEAYLDREAASALDARAGDRLSVLAAGRTESLRVAGVVRHEGAGSDGGALLMPLARAQQVLDRAGLVSTLLVSNRGGAASGAARTEEARRLLRPAAERAGLEVRPVKDDGLRLADDEGAAFLSLFSAFGNFTIAAGVLLIFLVFVMLAAERRAEMGTARAVGTRREHLVEIFLYEGAAYDLVAGAVGALLGVAIAAAMVTVLGSALGAEGVEIRRSFGARSVVIAYALGVLLTFAVVAISAWRVSRLNVVAAIRNLPEPARRQRRRGSVVLGVAGVLLGLLLATSGAGSARATPFVLGVSLVIVSAVPIARAAGVGERVATTGGAVALLAWLFLPYTTYRRLVPDLQTDFSLFVVGGLLVVVAVAWLVSANAPLLLGGLRSALVRVPVLAPVISTSVAYPLRNRFRTAVTLAMFTLVVFTLVVGATTSSSFLRLMDDQEAFGGGFDVRAEVAPTSPIGDLGSAVRRSPGPLARQVTAVGAQSTVPVAARQPGPGAGRFEDYVVRGLDDGYLRRTGYELAALAGGYRSSRQVWDALARTPGLAVVDSWSVPRRGQWGFGGAQAFQRRGFVLEDGTFDAVPLDVRDPLTGEVRRLTVIGVLKDSTPVSMAGISTGQRTLGRFGARAEPNVYYVGLRPGVDARDAARDLERAFLAHGMEAEAQAELLHRAVAVSLTFQWLVLGFMGLGLVIGVAALGVVAARSVVERRQQIGVLRAIGFRRRMVEAAFLVESSFVSLVAVVAGSVLGLLMARNVVADAARDANNAGITLSVPWLTLVTVFVVVYLASLGATLVPARRAARVEPADALRYE